MLFHENDMPGYLFHGEVDGRLVLVDVDGVGEGGQDLVPEGLRNQVDPDGVEVLHVLGHEEARDHLVDEGEGQAPDEGGVVGHDPDQAHVHLGRGHEGPSREDREVVHLQVVLGHDGQA